MDRLSDVDLTLLPVLQDLLRTRSTTLTARRLGKTQSSTSHALARLRGVFGDPLLVRVGRALSPTRFAEDLAPRVDAALGTVASLFDASPLVPFDPAALDRAFLFAGTDFSELILLPHIVRRMAREAPRVDLVCKAAGAEVERMLQEREVDLAFGTLFRERAGIVVKKIAADHLVLVTRRGAQRSGRVRLTSKEYAAMNHVLVAPRGAPGGAVDRALEKLGMKRRVAVRVSHFMTAASLVAASDLVTAMPRSFANAIKGRMPIELRELPSELGRLDFAFSLAWNEQVSRDPSHQWFRALVEEAAAGAFSRA